MNILYLIYHAGNGGSEKYVYDLCNEVLRNGHTPLLGYCENGKLVTKLQELGVECIKLDMPSPYSIKAVFALKSIIRRYHIDIVHAQFPRENYLACLAKMSGSPIKVVYTAHVINEDIGVKYITNSIIGLFNHRLIAVSKAVQRDLEHSGYARNKTILIYNGLDIDAFKSSPLAIDSNLTRAIMRNMILDMDLSARKKSIEKIPDDDILLVNISRFSPEKGLEYLLDEFKKANACNEKIKLVLVGDGGQKDAILNKIRQLQLENEIFLMGYREDTWEILSGCDIYVSSSQKESLGYSILEAMLCSMPIIATDVGGCSELVNFESNCGFLVPYGSEELHEKILEFARERDYMTVLGENAHRYIERYFDKKLMMNRTMDIYEL